jgi:hypothetical protein
MTTPLLLTWRYDVAGMSILTDEAGHRYMLNSRIMEREISTGKTITTDTHNVQALDVPDVTVYQLRWRTFLNSAKPLVSTETSDTITRLPRGRKPTGIRKVG